MSQKQMSIISKLLDVAKTSEQKRKLAAKNRSVERRRRRSCKANGIGVGVTRIMCKQECCCQEFSSKKKVSRSSLSRRENIIDKFKFSQKQIWF